MSVLNMLNAKYFIMQNGQVQRNPNAMGNAWFVNKVSVVPNADAEISALDDFDPSSTAIVDIRYAEQLIDTLDNTNSNIVLTDYQPNYLRYEYDTPNEGVVIFSEIFYDKGWNAYINNLPVSHFRANYVLRGIRVPKGNNIIEFKFEPTLYKLGERISLASSLIVLFLLFFISFKELKS